MEREAERQREGRKEGARGIEEEERKEKKGGGAQREV